METGFEMSSRLHLSRRRSPPSIFPSVYHTCIIDKLMYRSCDPIC